MDKPRISDRSLEDLCIAIAQLRDEEDRYPPFMPKDILQEWVLDQLPVPIGRRA